MPAFDPFAARSQRENGTLVEFLRTYPGSIVNKHVARFVVWGKRARQLLTPQPWNYAFGSGSLLDRFVADDGQILLLGCDHDNVTFLHYVEHIIDVPDKSVARFKVPVYEHGMRVWREMEEFDTSGAGVHANWPGRFLRASCGHGTLAQTGNSGGLVGDARAFVLSSRGLGDFSLPVMQVIAADAGAASRLLSA